MIENIRWEEETCVLIASLQNFKCKMLNICLKVVYVHVQCLI